MGRSLVCASAMLLVVLAGCENGGVSLSKLLPPTSVDSAKSAPSDRPVPSPYLLSVIKNAAPDPVAALPEQLSVASRADDFNAGIVKRVAALSRQVQGNSRSLLAEFYSIQWYTPSSLASFNLPQEAKAWVANPRYKGTIAAICTQPRDDEASAVSINCASVIEQFIGAALSYRAAGDTSKAEDLYRRVRKEDSVIHAWMTDGRNCYEDFDDIKHAVRTECKGSFELRALYEGLSGRPEAMVGTLLAAEAMPPKLRDRAEIPYLGLFEEVGEQLRLRGQIRAFARAADLVFSAYPKLSYIDVDQSLLDEIDAQTNSPNGLPQAVNLLAIEARALKTYVHADVNWRAEMGLALDCRAAAIGARSPETRAEAAKEFDDLLVRYETAGEHFNTGYCLYLMAPVVGQADKQARILAVLEKSHKEESAKAEQDARKQTADDMAKYPEASLAYIRAITKSAPPWLIYALDNEQYKSAMVEILNASKTFPSKYVRDIMYKRATRMAVWNELHQAH